MGTLNLVLVVVGLVLLGLGLMRARGPWARLGELRVTQANLARYDAWRGGKRTAAGDRGPSTAELMEAELRGQAYRWAGVAVVGAVLLAAGLIGRF